MSTIRGRCHYRGGCEAPATVHILVDDESCSWACDEHYAHAMDLLKPLDHHPFGEICHLSTDLKPGMLWHYSTPERAGFCYIDDDELRELLAEHSLVLSSVSERSTR